MVYAEPSLRQLQLEGHFECQTVHGCSGDVFLARKISHTHCFIYDGIAFDPETRHASLEGKR
jgi:hypothetical protein